MSSLAHIQSSVERKVVKYLWTYVGIKFESKLLKVHSITFYEIVIC